MQPQLMFQATSIVVRGAFNPAVFHPSWFGAQGLIRLPEAEEADVKLVHPGAAIFDAEWLQVRVYPDRFQASTAQEPYYEPLRDLVLGTFELLGHTPLGVMGINRQFHFRLESEKVWHGVGNRLVPKEDWKGVLEAPGMRSLTIEGARPDGFDGYIRVRVEPSVRARPGVFVEVNDHYRLEDETGKSSGQREMKRLLVEHWRESMKRSLDIAQRVASMGAPT